MKQATGICLLIFIGLVYSHECPVLQHPKNGRVNFKTLKPGGIAAYTCDTGYRLHGHNWRVCQNNFTWKFESPVCEARKVSTTLPTQTITTPSEEQEQLVTESTTIQPITIKLTTMTPSTTTSITKIPSTTTSTTEKPSTTTSTTKIPSTTTSTTRIPSTTASTTKIPSTITSTTKIPSTTTSTTIIPSTTMSTTKIPSTTTSTTKIPSTTTSTTKLPSTTTSTTKIPSTTTSTTKIPSTTTSTTKIPSTTTSTTKIPSAKTSATTTTSMRKNKTLTTIPTKRPPSIKKNMLHVHFPPRNNKNVFTAAFKNNATASQTKSNTTKPSKAMSSTNTSSMKTKDRINPLVQPNRSKNGTLNKEFTTDLKSTVTVLKAQSNTTNPSKTMSVNNTSSMKTNEGINPLVQTNRTENALSNVTVCAQNSVYLACEKDQVIHVESAMFGRNNNHTCLSKWMKNEHCNARFSDRIVKGRCNGKPMCFLEAHTKVFGDPCIGTYKYLEVLYICRYRKM